MSVQLNFSPVADRLIASRAAPVPETVAADPHEISPLQNTGKPHLAFVDGLRALAALYVVMHHIWYNAPLTGAFGSAMDIWRFGRYAVDLFIVLSGFCLML